MQTLIKSIFGSKLYGTDLPSSDTDYKFLFLPDAKDLVMQRAAKHIQQNTNSTDVRNSSEDVDIEGFSLQQWFHLVTQGQTLAVEMLFLPESALVSEIHPLWNEIQSNRSKIVSKKVLPFIGYCRAQASKYCVKGSRVNAVKAIVEFLEPYTKGKQIHDPLNTILPELEKMTSIPFIELQTGQEHPNDNWLMVCGRKSPLTSAIFRAYQMYTNVLKDYGARAQVAASENGIDWKALYHSLRIAYEANELLTTGIITLPRPEAPLLKRIRQGEFKYEQVSDMIQEQVDLVEQNLLNTKLREEPDYKWVESIVYQTYLDVIKSHIKEC